MKKRGQVSVFIIIGVIALAAIILVFFYRDKITSAIRQTPTNPQEYLDQQLQDIKKEIGRCVSSETDKAAILLMEKGGNFDKEFGYVHYLNISYQVLCREINATNTCLSEPILVTDLQTKINNYLPNKIKSCIDFEAFRNKDYILTTGNLDTSVNIGEDNILVNLNIPVELKKDAYLAKENRFLYNLKIPLGDFVNLANKLVQIKASGKEISPIYEELVSFNKYFIHVYKPYPDEVYDISLTTTDKYHFYFAIEGIGEFPRPEGQIQ